MPSRLYLIFAFIIILCLGVGPQLQAVNDLGQYYLVCSCDCDSGTRECSCHCFEYFSNSLMKAEKTKPYYFFDLDPDNLFQGDFKNSNEIMETLYKQASLIKPGTSQEFTSFTYRGQPGTAQIEVLKNK